MLAKLIKLDLRFAYKQFLTMAVLLLALGIAVPYMEVGFLRFGVPIIFSVAFTVIPVMSVWLVMQHFKRNLYGNEGYLMFSLPVSATQLLLSKVITTLLWLNLMLIAALGFVLLLLRTELPVAEITRSLLALGLNFKGLQTLLLINANALPFILSIFLGTSLATVAVRNKKLGHFWGTTASFAASALFVWCSIRFAGWQYLTTTAANRALVLVTLADSKWINLVISAIFCALCFGLNTYIMRRRLNLD